MISNKPISLCNGGALLDGEIVGDATLTKPIINFAQGRAGNTSQTGVETDWTKPIKELQPLDINFVEIIDGTIAYKDLSHKPEVDLSIYNLNAHITNLRNVDLINNKDDGIDVLWESVVSVVMEILTNQPTDQFGTQVQLEDDLNNPQTDFWSRLNDIVRNAFVKAYSNTVKEE